MQRAANPTWERGIRLRLRVAPAPRGALREDGAFVGQHVHGCLTLSGRQFALLKQPCQRRHSEPVHAPEAA